MFQEPPLVAFRRARTIRSEIVRTDHLKKRINCDEPTATSPCSKCKACKLISKDTEVTNIQTNRSIPVAGGNCLTKEVIYSASCKKCSLVYIGHTGEELRTRISKHRYDAKNRPKNCELAKHVQSNPGHSFDEDIKFSILRIGLKNQNDREREEDKVVCRLGTLFPTGINEMQGLHDYAKEMYDFHQRIWSQF